jgi:undecaprenyl phosphate-alpha-L-ara4N flippase subunit ArnE
MSYVAALLIFISLSCFVAGQLLLKQAVDLIESKQSSKQTRVLVFAGAIAAFAVNFFLNIGLLQRFDLSYFFPFQGLSVILIALLGAWILKEKVGLRLTIGSFLISAGVILVSLT